MKISVCEAICLRWAVEGKGSRDIAVLEAVPVEMVASLFSSALTKLGASTLVEAIENAKMREVI